LRSKTMTTSETTRHGLPSRGGFSLLRASLVLAAGPAFSLATTTSLAASEYPTSVSPRLPVSSVPARSQPDVPYLGQAGRTAPDGLAVIEPDIRSARSNIHLAEAGLSSRPMTVGARRAIP